MIEGGLTVEASFGGDRGWDDSDQDVLFNERRLAHVTCFKASFPRLELANCYLSAKLVPGDWDLVNDAEKATMMNMAAEKEKGRTFREANGKLELAAVFGQRYRLEDGALPKLRIQLKRKGLTGNATVGVAEVDLAEVQDGVYAKQAAARKAKRAARRLTSAAQVAHKRFVVQQASVDRAAKANKKKGVEPFAGLDDEVLTLARLKASAEAALEPARAGEAAAEKAEQECYETSVLVLRVFAPGSKDSEGDSPVAVGKTRTMPHSLSTVGGAAPLGAPHGAAVTHGAPHPAAHARGAVGHVALAVTLAGGQLYATAEGEPAPLRSVPAKALRYSMLRLSGFNMALFDAERLTLPDGTK